MWRLYRYVCIMQNNFAKILLLKKSTASIKNRINLTLFKETAGLLKYLCWEPTFFGHTKDCFLLWFIQIFLVIRITGIKFCWASCYVLKQEMLKLYVANVRVLAVLIWWRNLKREFLECANMLYTHVHCRSRF